MPETTSPDPTRRRLLAGGAAAAGAGWVAPSVLGTARAVAAGTGEAVDCVITPDSSLVGFWRGEGNYQDSSGSGNHGAEEGSVPFVSGVQPGCQAFDFPGANGNEVVVSNDSSLQMTNAVSMAAWLYPTGAGSGGSSPSLPVAQGGIVVNKEGEYEFARFSDGTIWFAVVTESSPGVEGQSWTWLPLGSLTAPLNTWTHIAVAIDAAGGFVYGWKNGGGMVTEEIEPGTIGDVHDEDTLRIGGRERGDHNFDGRIDEVQVFNRVLTDSDLQPIRECTP